MVDLEQDYSETEFLGAVGMMCREWGGTLKYSEQNIFNRLQRTTGILNSYVTEGDGIRRAAESRTTVYQVDGSNARKQSEQYRQLTNEIIQLL